MTATAEQRHLQQQLPRKQYRGSSNNSGIINSRNASNSQASSIAGMQAAA